MVETVKLMTKKDIIMDQEQRNRLIEILTKQISPWELQHLIFELFGGEGDTSEKQHSKRALSFIEKVYQHQRRQDLLNAIARLRSDIDLSKFGIRITSLLAEEPKQTPFIPFSNRKIEWERILLHPEGWYYAFGGPAGYGKTALLHKIRDEFQNWDWLCAYIALPEYNGFHEVIQEIAKQAQLEETLPIIYHDPNETAQLLGKKIAQYCSIHPFINGFVLLIDVDHAPWASLIEMLKILIEKIIPGLYDGLESSGYFSTKPSGYRVVIAGREIATYINKQCDYGYSEYNVTRLTPFNYQVTLDICRQNIPDIEEQEAFAPHLLFYSGGHPRCMVHILKAFQQANTTTDKFVSSQKYQNQIREIVLQEANWVHTSIGRDFRSVFDAFCIYRQIDQALLMKFLEKGVIWDGIAEDWYDLATKLKKTSLMKWTFKTPELLSDDIVRRMLTIKLRHDIPSKQFMSSCEQAKDWYIERLKTSPTYQAYWAIEALFEFLQGHGTEIEDQKTRQMLRQNFFECELPSLLEVFFEHCEDPRQGKDALFGILEDDWEFCFTLNYYLRDIRYTESPYQGFLQRIEHEARTRWESKKKKDVQQTQTTNLQHFQGEKRMALLELLTTATVPTIVKYLFDQFGKITDRKIEKQLEEAKKELAPYQEKSPTESTDIEHVKKQVNAFCEVLQVNGIDIASETLFREWSEQKLEDEELAVIIKREFEIIINKAGKLHINNEIRRNLEDLANAIELNVKHLEKARREARISGLRGDQEEVERREITLKKTLREARAFINKINIH